MLPRSSSAPARAARGGLGRRARLTLAAAALAGPTLAWAPVPTAAATVTTATTARAAAAAADPDPLAVSIDSLSPSVIPVKGPLVVSGRIFNTSNEEWRGINVYPLLSTSPFTTHEELVEAMALDPSVEVGQRT
ncbi:MAG: hypothetical protein R2731_08295 [Nocardioides sp.]